MGVNEALFREVNDRIDELQVDLGGAATFEIVCECGDSACVQRFGIDATAYTELRRDVHHFAVVPGHEQPDVERVVGTYDGYLVVEKTDPDAAEAAEATA